MKPYFDLSIQSNSKGKVHIYEPFLEREVGNFSHEFKAGTEVKLTASPAFDCELDHWEGSINSSNDSPQFIMNEDKTVEAVFKDVFVKNVELPNDPVKHKTGKGIEISWNQVEEDSSGIGEYEIRYKNTNNGQIPINTSAGSNQSVHSTSNLSSECMYRAQVRAVDRAGNKSENWSETEKFSPKPSPASFSVVPESSPDQYNYLNFPEPKYKVRLEIDDVDAAKYIIKRRETKEESWQNLEPIAVLTDEELATRNYTYIDKSGLEAHKKYQYKIITKNITGTKRTISAASSWKKIPNIDADFNIESELINKIATKDKSYTVDIAPSDDIEGDTLKFRLKYRNSSIDGEWQGRNQFYTTSQEVKFDSDGVWEWKLEVREYNTIDPIKDENGDPISQLRSGTIKIDTKAPSGKFKIKDRTDNQIEYTEDQPAKSKKIKLFCSELTDAAGRINSQVKQVRFWNGKRPDKFYARNQIVTENNKIDQDKADEIKSGEAGIEVSSSSADSVPWLLADGPDGKRTVKMEVEDGAGNVSKPFTKTTVLDTTAPSVPVEDTFKHSYKSLDTGEKLVYQWLVNEPDWSIKGVNNFVVSKVINGEETGFNQGKVEFIRTEKDKAKGLVSVDISSLTPNQPVKIEVKSVDKAGNKSQPVIYTAYTKAELGAINYQTGGYNKETEQHYLNWKLTDAGIASRHILEYGKKTSDGFSVIKEIKLSENNEFIHTNLDPHQQYEYRLAAVNGSGDKTYGQIFSRKVPNTPPTAPSLNAPINYGREEVEFNFEAAKDYDGDNLTYHVYFAKGANPDSYTKLGEVTKDEKLKKSNLNHKETYSWYVVADDGYNNGLTENQPVDGETEVEFTVDVNKPSLEVEELRRPFTNQEQLRVEVSDDLSGIKNKQVVYKRLKDNGDLINKGKVDLEENSNGKLVAGIPLVEGAYHLHVFIEDKAGNKQQTELNNLLVDHTAPQVSKLTASLEQTNGRYLTGSSPIPVNIEASDDFTEVKNLHYWFVKSQGEETGKEANVISVSPNLTNYAYNFDLSGENDQEYYLAVKAEDGAGNKSEVTYLGPIYVDRTAPKLDLDLTGFHSAGSSYYLTDINKLDKEVSAVDNESKVVDVKYNLKSMATGELITNWSDWTTLKETSLTAGKKYRVVAKAVNKVGLETVVKSDEFIFDNTAPVNVSLGGPTESLVSEELIEFAVGSTEEESSVVKYRLAVGSSPGGTDLTSLVKGSKNGWLEFDSAQTAFRFSLPQIENGTYYPTVEVVNAAGLRTKLTGDSFTIDNNQEKVIVSDQGPYTMFSNQLTGWWQYKGSKKVTGYKYRITTIVGGNKQIVQNWQQTEKTKVTESELNLTSGQEYYFEVQALYSSGGQSTIEESPGVIVDNTPPKITNLKTPDYTTSWDLEFDWSGIDKESGIKKVEVALGSDYYKTDVTEGWVEINGNRLSCDTNGDQLNLTSGERYYLTLRLINGAGRVTEQAAQSIQIDDTPPPMPIVRDQGSYINTEQPLEAHWIWSPIDQESGNQSYEWALLKHGEDISNVTWHQSPEDKKIDLSDTDAYPDLVQEHGHTYYFAVKVTNGSGLSKIGISNGIMADKTAPFIPEVKLLDAINLSDAKDAEEINYITNNNELGLWMQSMDPESEIAKYLYAWGAWEQVDNKERYSSDKNQIELTEPTIPEGDVTTFAGETINSVEEKSATGYSTGVMLDTGAPKIKNVKGCVSDNKLIFDWGVEASKSPVAGYEVALVTEDKMNSTPDSDAWISVGLDQSITLDGSKYPDGNYRLLVRGYNAAGTYSRRGEGIDEWGVSPRIVLDRTKPQITEFKYDQYVSSQLNVKLGASDNLSGINSYQYALGTLVNPTEFSGDWVDINKNEGWIEFNVNTEDIPHKTKMYLMVRTKDNVGLWSEAKVSREIVVDHTPPASPEVSCGQHTTSKSKIEGIGYTASDAESGIIRYQLSIVNNSGGEWLTTPEPKAVDKFNGRLTNLSLKEAEDYQLVMQVKNRAGLWSTVGYSQPIVVDTIPPKLNFAQSGEEIVLNEPPIDVEYSLSEQAKVDFSLTSEDGTSSQSTASGTEGTNYYTFTKGTPATYTLAAKATDPAGNIGKEKVQKIRVNAPPKIMLPTEIKTNPGEPTELTAKVVDPDGHPVSYEWKPGDGGAKLTAETPTYRYTELGDYTLELIVTDNDKGVSTATTTVKVRNTKRGKLYMDEVWSGKHKLYGDVTVPEGINLTITPGTEVIVAGIVGETGYNNALIINGNLTVNGVTEEVVIKSVKDGPGSWKGIYIAGTGEIKGLTVKEALRGITAVESSTVSISGSVFQYNKVGLQIYDCQPKVNSTSFLNNIWYGIKEDSGGRPTVIDCIFSDNGIMYYHQQLTDLSIEELNSLGENEGNQRK